MSWILIIWVLHSQTYIPGYPSEEACDHARKVAKERAQGATTIYCIPGPPNVSAIVGAPNGN